MLAGLHFYHKGYIFRVARLWPHRDYFLPMSTLKPAAREEFPKAQPTCGEAVSRRKFIQSATLVASGLMLRGIVRAAQGPEFPIVRTPMAKRRFKSEAVEHTIQKVRSTIGNKEIAWMFENCFPNTLDTTVEFEMVNGR